MNVSKYPPSLLFFLATLGPMAIVCAYVDKWNGWLKDALVMFGRVSFAFYVAHVYLIHLLSIFFGMGQGFEAKQFPFLCFLSQRIRDRTYRCIRRLVSRSCHSLPILSMDGKPEA